MPKKKKRFEAWLNEGAFFHEPWITDNTTGKHYRYDKIPRKIMREFASEIRECQQLKPLEADILLQFAIHGR